MHTPKTCATCARLTAVDRRPCLSCHDGSRYREKPERRRARLFAALVVLAILAAMLWAGTMDYADLVAEGVIP